MVLYSVETFSQKKERRWGFADGALKNLEQGDGPIPAHGKGVAWSPTDAQSMRS